MEENGNPPADTTRLERFLESRYFLVLVIVLVAAIAFILGRVSKLERVKEPVRITSEAQPAAAIQSQAANPTSPKAMSGGVVASKSGGKYHYPWCPGAKQISEKNKITFNSIEEARAKGYTPASNCKGLK